ncbi:hypothetical protein [Sodalinema gerasimenkoae]|uniref:hypothetical protein n=1 Tax=Sodalinema gerasimenkoae TaxID=2862348 RepID=UPI001357DE13|nr:hypothetical protein [Sodalinema gerasimenkoae]
MKDPFVRSPRGVDPADNIVQQARQGSIAAIVQVLNDNLTDLGVRTRAVFAEGWLQLLCESPQAQGLDIDEVVERIQELLESISARNIRRVNIYCRVAREEQLLWLDEIRRDPENQLLWSKSISIRRPNLVQRLLNPQRRPTGPRKVALPRRLQPSQPRNPERDRQLLIGSIIFILVLLLGGIWAYRTWISSLPSDSTDLPADDPSTPNDTSPPPPPPQLDAFAQAVTLAEQASFAGQTAETRAEWLDLAAKWQRAADLMAQVPPDDSRYQTARDRTQLYRQNSQVAQQRAEQVEQTDD